jgi:hypothetical protein
MENYEQGIKVLDTLGGKYQIYPTPPLPVIEKATEYKEIKSHSCKNLI